MDVHDPNSPYGLIQDILTPSQSNAGINKKKIPDLNSNDLGGLQSNEVWLSEGNLLILKGIGSMHNKYNTKKNLDKELLPFLYYYISLLTLGMSINDVTQLGGRGLPRGDVTP